MDYREFRHNIETTVEQSRKDNVELDIYLQKETFNTLMAWGIEFFFHRGDLNIIFSDGRIITISTLEQDIELSGVTSRWKVVKYDDYNNNILL